MRVRRLIPLLVALAAVFATPASGDVASRKQSIDARLQRVQAKLAWAQQRERTLSGQIATVNGEIRTLDRQAGAVASGSRRSSATWRSTRRSSTG